jgi:hypothetical protein
MAAHVRALNPHLLAALHEGMTRSRTLRQLVAALDASDVVIYLEEGACSDAAACTMFAGTSNGVRWLRTNFVLRTPTGATSLLCHRERLIAQIGHELQHAVEIANHADVNDERTLSQLYGRIGRRRGRATAYESAAAIQTGERVLAEVREQGAINRTQ